ncbi:carbohydrate porin [Lutimonas halocynthiae]|uniref:carbohydrate porin n=1 Tax=Lutimonas halocynthiae TaxID=1446477 RepID=UPI0025B5C5A3|nr:carbohydrate porin [Lutimonas halocynthiae]MDN3643046.1 carbohydrate porin [Lutimonas halocynthiae]
MPSFKTYKILYLFVVLSACNLYSQEADSTKQKSTLGFGGPDQVERRLEKDEEPKNSFFDFEFMQPYFDFKSDLKKNTGFDFGLDYSAVYFGASESLGEKNASSGMVRLYGSWELVNRGKGNNGALIYKIEHRHKYTEVVPKFFGFEMGYVGMEVPAFNDDGFRMTNFYWRQRFKDGKISVVAGLLDATDYVDVYALASPWTGFMNFQFSTGSQAVYIPNDAALGIGIGAYITDNLFVIASLSDAGADPTDPFKSFETFFSNNDYFKSIEVGYVTSRDRFYMDNVHVTFWHSDGSDVTASLPGWGIAFSATHYFENSLNPFIRGGFAEDGGTLLQKSITAGLGYQPKAGGHLLGFAIGWGEPNETTFSEGLDNQFTAEIFYRLQVSKHFVITPDIQYLINPALNPDESSIFVWGVRGRINL